MLYDRYTRQERKMKKKKSNRILLTILLLMVLVFAFVTFRTAKYTYDKNVAEENITEPDFYAMAEFSDENSKAVIKALKSGNAEKTGSLMIDPAGIDNVLSFAKWKDMDTENVVSLGAGSFSTAPDKDGKIDISERFIVPVGDKKYVLYIETITSRHGMINDGVSVIAATAYDHFVELDSGWNGEADDSSAVAGKSFLSKK